VVTIDGPAAAGKSTTARALACRLGWLYLDSGALYRAVAFAAAERGIASEDEAGLRMLLETTEIDVEASDERTLVRLDGEDVTDRLRDPRVTAMSSRVAAQPAVRARVTALLRRVAARAAVVAEGRDMGTVVFPDALLKIHLVASMDARARRRTEEWQKRGLEVDLEDVRSEMEARDGRDAGRAVSPLREAEDSVVVDTSDRERDEVVETIARLVAERRGAAT
jgi:cytidylate kinase